MTMTQTILSEGRNYWRAAQAERGALLVDGEAYFSAVQSAFEQARESIFILGWDIDSRVRLRRDAGSGEPLGSLLNRLVSLHRQLHVHVLIWDFSMIYTLEREWFSAYRLGWKTRRRLQFRTDSVHPVAASHHQKIVVVDDSVAFVGGFDLTRSRWDTRSHEVHDPRRVDSEGRVYPPFHDVQMIVDGPAAQALGELARERWRRAVGAEPMPASHPPTSHAVWPESVEPSFRDTDVALARTLPSHDGYEAVREVETLYLDSIAAAQRWIYAENQYLTSDVLGKAFAERLGEEHGPEIVLVLPRETSGWLERNTMDVLRSRFLQRIRAADRHGRLRVYYPGLEGGQSVNLHGKVMIVDDRLLRVGSSNLSNRSMGLDTECDAAIEARMNSDQCRVIARTRNDLLAEHLGVGIEAVEQAISEHGSLIGAIESLRGEGRSLQPLDGAVPEEIDRQIPDSAVVDPEQPLNAEKLKVRFLPLEQRRTASYRGLRLAVLVIALVVLAGIWRWTSLGTQVGYSELQIWLEQIKNQPLTPLVLLGIYLLASLLVFPITVVVGVTIVIFGPLLGFVYALLGSLAGAVITFGVGHYLGRDLMMRFHSQRLSRLGSWLAERGILTVMAMRMLPVAPFTVLNIVAGASGIRFRDFVLGSVLGMLPGLAAVSLFVDRLVVALRDPGWKTYSIAVAVGVALAGGLWLIGRWLGHRVSNQP